MPILFKDKVNSNILTMSADDSGKSNEELKRSIYLLEKVSFEVINSVVITALNLYVGYCVL